MVYIKRKRKKSFCWKFFEYSNHGGSCTICGAFIRTFGNTTNLLTHLRRRHSGIYIGSLEERDGNYRYSKKDIGKLTNGRHSTHFDGDATSHVAEADMAVHTLQAYRSENGETVIFVEQSEEDIGGQTIQIQNGHFQPVITSTDTVNGEVITVAEHPPAEKETPENTSSLTNSDSANEKPEETTPTPKKYIVNSLVKNYQGSSVDSKIALRQAARPSPIHPVTSSSAGQKEDTFDHFGKYIASLLRNLPSRKAACRLQGEMVNWVMREQMKLPDS